MVINNRARRVLLIFTLSVVSLTTMAQIDFALPGGKVKFNNKKATLELPSNKNVLDSMAQVRRDTTHAEPIIRREVEPQVDPATLPEIVYTSSPATYRIDSISISGIKDYEDFILIGFSGLSIGDTIAIPGDQITAAVKRFWKHGLFSDVTIRAMRIQDGNVWLDIKLRQRPRISEVNYFGVKKSEKDDLLPQVGIEKGGQITPNTIDRAKKRIVTFYDGKGYGNAQVSITQRDDRANPNQVVVDIKVDKKEKIKVNQIIIEGNTALTDSKLKWVIKKTNERKDILKIFRQKKFVEEDYKNDKDLIVQKYNELGYRDAQIIADSVRKFDEKSVNVYITVEEGHKYHLRNLAWVGNTVYNSDILNQILKMKGGDVYNQKLLNERISTDEDAVSNYYLDNGYLFFNVDPVEVKVENDSIDLEIRVYEGKPATINKVKILGNDRLYEHVVRRELRTKPGQLFNKSDIQRSAREIAQTGHFNPEAMNIYPEPHPEDGTVDIVYGLESKSNDQVELSAGWGQTGIIGKLSLKFTNFSLRNLFNPKRYKGIIPQGDGQQLTLSGQTNGSYYQSYSISFVEPWLGGKRPNSLSFSAYYSAQTDVSNYYYGSGYGNSYNYGGTGGYGGYGNGYDNGYGNGYDATFSYDPDKYIRMFGTSLGYGMRLSWPDDYFQFYVDLSYQLYMLKDWRYFIMQNGECHNISLNLTLSRNSIDNPLYTRKGSQISVSLGITPPYSLFDGVDYTQDYKALPMEQRHKMVEYHKWKFKAKFFTPLDNAQKLVLMSRIEFGFVGHFNPNKRSPFGTFYVGGDGMTGYSSTYATETVGLRGYRNGSLSDLGNEGYAYTRLALELRYPIIMQNTTTIYALAFVEAGNSWNKIENFNPFDLKRSAGLGVRIFLPMVGLLGVDWAWGFDPIMGNRGSSGSNFHFIIGQEF